MPTDSRRPILYSAGYGGGLALDAFCAFVQRENLTVADLRLKPYSNRNPTWNRNALRERLGARYASIQELGNLNYKGGPVAFRDEAAGLAKLMALLQAGDVVALCVCQDPAVCHRTVAIQKLRTDVDVRPLPAFLKGGA